MAFRTGNRMTPREQKNMSDLLALIEQSNDSDLQHEANMYKLRQSFGRDSMESEQVEYSNADPDNELTREYARRKDAMRNVGTNSSDFDKNRDAIMRESRNTDSLTQQNAAKSRDFDAFSKPAYR